MIYSEEDYQRYALVTERLNRYRIVPNFDEGYLHVADDEGNEDGTSNLERGVVTEFLRFKGAIL